MWWMCVVCVREHLEDCRGCVVRELAGIGLSASGQHEVE